jgi:hypothetical protein
MPFVLKGYIPPLHTPKFLLTEILEEEPVSCFDNMRIERFAQSESLSTSANKSLVIPIFITL